VKKTHYYYTGSAHTLRKCVQLIYSSLFTIITHLKQNCRIIIHQTQKLSFRKFRNNIIYMHIRENDDTKIKDIKPLKWQVNLIIYAATSNNTDQCNSVIRAICDIWIIPKLCDPIPLCLEKWGSWPPSSYGSAAPADHKRSPKNIWNCKRVITLWRTHRSGILCKNQPSTVTVNLFRHRYRH